MRNLRTDEYIVRRQLDQNSVENYRSALTTDSLKLAQALFNAADFYLPTLRKETATTDREGLQLAAFGALIWSVAIWHWVSLQALGTAILVLAAIGIALSWRAKSRGRKVLELFESPFLDLGDVLKGHRAEPVDTVE